MSFEGLKTPSVFQKLGLSEQPVMLAPLAGVSDHPFRRICARLGADLTYVEMLSASALLYENRRTLEMAERHESENVLGVQLTGRSADDTARAVELLSRMPFDTIDINMGCPVSKVVKTGCGSAILRDPERVYETVRKSVQATDKPVSAKIRIGWDRDSINAMEIADAVAQAGAAWLSVHGRTRSDDYSAPVDLPVMAEVVAKLKIPVIGNGNIFGRGDAQQMQEKTRVRGVMVSRGALGDPWVFARIKGRTEPVGVDEWHTTVCDHLRWQQEAYGNTNRGAVCMRKHLLWYLKGWPSVREWKDQLGRVGSLEEAIEILGRLHKYLKTKEIVHRSELSEGLTASGRFVWDPKWEMDRQLDRGVGHEGLDVVMS